MASRTKRAVVMAAGAIVMAGLGPASLPGAVTRADGASLSIGYKHLGTTCVPAPNGNVRARVKYRMIVNNVPKTRLWAQGMKLKARLIPVTPGLSLQRNWMEQRKSGLLKKRARYAFDFTVLTDVVTPAADSWAPQVKLIWDRVAPIPDVVLEFKSKHAVPLNCGDDGISSASP